jgi:transcriptional regulator with XRE-family HTH domain
MAQGKANTIAPQDSLRAIIRKRRLALNLTQDQLGWLAGYDRTYVNMIEGGRRNPSLNAILNLCCVLGILPSTALKKVEKEAGLELVSRARLDAAVAADKRERITKFRK